MKVLIIDNEASLRHILKSMVLMLNKSFVVDEAGGVVNGIEKINSFNPDVVLLDVEMQDGTGFDLLKQLTKVQFQLIFVTAYNQYAVQAFKFSAIDYLLKPVDPTELQNSLQKAQENIANHILKQQLEVLLLQMNKSANDNLQIVLKDTRKTYFIQINDILYCKADGAYTVFYLMDKTTICQSHNLKYFEEMLEQYGFIRPHHSYIVNKNRVRNFDKKNDTLILDDETAVPVAQRKRDIIAEMF